ncbi:hypothetical protein [Gimesia algae]|uniref:Uncharacterized protein n=1 Tax=Gimesia algae TaxID=2527971 RepID=A0A517VAA5_9PLAN|nr:hypothetical protein [Gimesia algae]QDT89940.1 hypothetical protein Pan161_15730 [Gimesia algae]
MKRIDTKQNRTQKNRRGIAILWLVIWGSFFLTFFCVVLELATLWEAQVELNDALDSAALATVSEWNTMRNLSNYSTEIPREVGIDYAAANTVLGVPVPLTSNYDSGNSPNENETCAGNIILGNLTSSGSVYEFNAGTTGNLLAVRVQATIPLNGFCTAMFGATLFDVSASSTAYFDSLDGKPKLVRISAYTCN